MQEHDWFPVSSDKDLGMFQITYRNELGEEYIHVADDFGVDLSSSSVHSLCWPKCSGDWPGCRMNCPLFNGPVQEEAAERKRFEIVPPYDPFNFMLNRDWDLDDNNCYVESFDTLDGTHWEIAVDVSDQVLQLLDEETKDGDAVSDESGIGEKDRDT